MAMDRHMTDRIWCLEDIDIFKKIPSKVKMGLGKLAKVVLHNKGEMIFLPGDPSESVYFLKKGRVKLAHLDETGKKITITICERGEPFGEMALAGEDERSLIAETLDDVEEGRVLKIRLTHQEISDLIGATRETTSTTLGEFESERMIEKSGRFFVITDVSRMTQSAQK